MAHSPSRFSCAVALMRRPPPRDVGRNGRSRVGLELLLDDDHLDSVRRAVDLEPTTKGHHAANRLDHPRRRAQKVQSQTRARIADDIDVAVLVRVRTSDSGRLDEALPDHREGGSHRLGDLGEPVRQTVFFTSLEQTRTPTAVVTVVPTALDHHVPTVILVASRSLPANLVHGERIVHRGQLERVGQQTGGRQMGLKCVHDRLAVVLHDPLAHARQPGGHEHHLGLRVEAHRVQEDDVVLLPLQHAPEQLVGEVVVVPEPEDDRAVRRRRNLVGLVAEDELVELGGRQAPHEVRVPVGLEGLGRGGRRVPLERCTTARLDLVVDGLERLVEDDLSIDAAAPKLRAEHRLVPGVLRPLVGSDDAKRSITDEAGVGIDHLGIYLVPQLHSVDHPLTRTGGLGLRGNRSEFVAPPDDRDVRTRQEHRLIAHQRLDPIGQLEGEQLMQCLVPGLPLRLNGIAEDEQGQREHIQLLPEDRWKLHGAQRHQPRRAFTALVADAGLPHALLDPHPLGSRGTHAFRVRVLEHDHPVSRVELVEARRILHEHVEHGHPGTADRGLVEVAHGDRVQLEQREQRRRRRDLLTLPLRLGTLRGASRFVGSHVARPVKRELTLVGVDPVDDRFHHELVDRLEILCVADGQALVSHTPVRLTRANLEAAVRPGDQTHDELAVLIVSEVNDPTLALVEDDPHPPVEPGVGQPLRSRLHPETILGERAKRLGRDLHDNTVVAVLPASSVRIEYLPTPLARPLLVRGRLLPAVPATIRMEAQNRLTRCRVL